jgi:hypothetical protein
VSAAHRSSWAWATTGGERAQAGAGLAHALTLSDAEFVNEDIILRTGAMR